MFQKWIGLRNRKVAVIAALMVASGSVLVGGAFVETADALSAKQGCLKNKDAATGYAYYHRSVGDPGYWCDRAMINTAKSTFRISIAKGQAAPRELANTPRDTAESGGLSCGSDCQGPNGGSVSGGEVRGPEGQRLSMVANTTVRAPKTCTVRKFKIDNVQYWNPGNSYNVLYRCTPEQIRLARGA